MLTPEQELQRSLRLGNGIKRLGRLEAIDALGDALGWESDAVKFQTALDQAAIANSNLPSSELETEAAMQKKTLIAGDNYNYYRELEQAQPAAVTQPQPQPQPQPSGMSQLLGPAMLGAAMLGTGAGGVMLYDYLTAMPDGAAVVQPADPGDWKLGVEVKPGPK